MKIIKYTLLGIASTCLVYHIYLSTPYTTKTYISPYKKAKIKVVKKSRNAFFAYNVGPVDSYYEIVSNNKIIERVDSYFAGAPGGIILNVKWYKDSVVVTYEVVDIKIDTVLVHYTLK